MLGTNLTRGSTHGSEHGATAVEYAFLVALVSTVIIGAVFLLGAATGDRMCEPIRELRAGGQDVEGCD